MVHSEVWISPNETINKRKMRSLWIIVCALAFLTESSHSYSYNCPDTQYCYCQEDSGNAEFLIHCSSSMKDMASFDLTIRGHENLVIECRNAPDWAEFLYGAKMNLGRVKTVIFNMCSLPRRDGPRSKNMKDIVEQLGLKEVESLRFRLHSTDLEPDDLAAFPEAKTIFLSNNGIRNVSRYLLQGVPKLRLLDLRDNKIKLPLGIFENATTLTTLELSGNHLKTIEPGLFDGLTNLKLLNLWRNDFETIDPRIFANLKNLTSLDINRNKLQNLPVNVFHNLENLEVINLSFNNLTTLPHGLFEKNTHLKTVKIMQNKQNMTTLPSKLLANLMNLTQVKLTKCGLLWLPEDLFWGSPNLSELFIDRNYLTTLPQEIFRDTKNLIDLKMNFNDLQSLPDKGFISLEALTKLDLSKNHLTAINSHTFTGLKNVLDLNLENNDLKHVHRDAFRRFSNLKVARLSRNKLTLKTGVSDFFGPISPLGSCSTLEELYLSYNEVSEMFSDWMMTLPKLRILDLTYNQFTMLQAQEMQFTSDNINIDLRFNNISQIHLGMLELQAANQTHPRDVIINVAENPIQCDCHLYDFLRFLNGDMHPYTQNYVHIKYDKLKCNSPADMNSIYVGDIKPNNLMCRIHSSESKPGDPCSVSGYCDCWERPSDKALIVDCSEKNLTRAPEWIEAKAYNHVELNLENNMLAEAPTMRRIGYGKITILNLAKNNISNVDVQATSMNLEVLHLHGNNLTSLNSKVLDALANSSKLKQLTLHDNPWKCDCSARDLLSYIQTNIQVLPELNSIHCKASSIPLFDMTHDELCPSLNQLYIFISSIVACIGIILGCLAALYYRYQREIKVWLFSKNICMCLVSEEDLDDDKIYDAFISYSHKDEEFVVKELFPKLTEGPDAYKLCIHFRDWVAGDYIPTQIARSVQESKRTIIVVSPNFLESVWGRLEFQTAHKQALNDKRSRVILVVYGDIGSLEDLDPELKAYMTMNTYIKWGDPWFWKHLKYALPHRKGTRSFEDVERMNSRNIKKIQALENSVFIIDEKKNMENANGLMTPTWA